MTCISGICTGLQSLELTLAKTPTRNSLPVKARTLWYTRSSWAIAGRLIKQMKAQINAECAVKCLTGYSYDIYAIYFIFSGFFGLGIMHYIDQVVPQGPLGWRQAGVARWPTRTMPRLHDFPISYFPDGGNWVKA